MIFASSCCRGESDCEGFTRLDDSDCEGSTRLGDSDCDGSTRLGDSDCDGVHETSILSRW
jgi:hypothetical protein